MSTFRVGQRVVCINNKPFFENVFNNSLLYLKEGEIYTVEKATHDGLLLKEVKSSHPTNEFNITRFRPLDELSNTTYNEVMEWIESGKPIEILN